MLPSAPHTRAQPVNDFNSLTMQQGDGKTSKWYGYKNTSLAAATFPFGAGLYYTTFTLTVKQHHEANLVSADAPATFDVTFKNTGAVSSRCRVILLAKPTGVSDDAAPKPFPVQQVVTFGGSPVLAPNESYTTSFDVRRLDHEWGKDGGGIRSCCAIVVVRSGCGLCSWF